MVKRLRRTVSLAVLAVAAAGAGCTPPAQRTAPVVKRAYGGPPLGGDRIGILTPARRVSGSVWRVAVIEINGVKKMGQWRSGQGDQIYLAPGDYRFTVAFQQWSGSGGQVGLFDLLDDVTTTLGHEQRTVAFTVAAGVVYRIHYRPDDQVYFVSTADGVVDDVPMSPPAGAVECVANPDRSAKFWCMLVPEEG